jgi:cobalt transporter subunit CbtB
MGSNPDGKAFGLQGVHMWLSRFSPTIASHAGSPALARAWQTSVLALLGVLIVFAVGFASAPGMHDAAHDTRHSFNFPCH